MDLGLYELPALLRLSDGVASIPSGPSMQDRKASARIREKLARSESLQSVYLHRREATRVIVCLEPIVVLSVPVESRSYATSFPELEVDRDGLIAPPTGYFVTFPWGAEFGTSVPFHPEVVWFSPDLEVGPVPPRFVSDRERRIDVPWGELILRREGDRWVVHPVVER
ncbi:MAG: hypothetical protein KJO43_05605 [Phycisphaerae bacterium]|nr:hypothetical protein [Phycisphaerae bacterium]